MGGAAASPLAEIERTVQERAKDISLEMAAPGGEAKLRALIADEVARWNDDHRRGCRAFALPDPDLVVERAFRNLARYGPLTPLLADDDVWEVMVNAPDAVFVRRHQGPSGYHDEVFHDDDHVLRTLTKLLDDASTAHRSLDPAEGLQDAQLDDGARVHIVHGDIARGGHVLVNIRKFTGIPFRSLGELVERDMLTAQVAALLAACVRARLSIVFAGPPGSGKTTLLSCTTAELDPSLRVVVAEEVFESDIPVPNVAQMQTRAARSDRPGVDLRRLVAGFLRMAPDVAVVGEVRDREALPELLAHVDTCADLVGCFGSRAGCRCNNTSVTRDEDSPERSGTRSGVSDEPTSVSPVPTAGNRAMPAREGRGPWNPPSSMPSPGTVLRRSSSRPVSVTSSCPPTSSRPAAPGRSRAGQRRRPVC